MKYSNLIFSIILLLGLISCKNTELDGVDNAGQIALKVTFGGESFDDGGVISPLASSKQLTSVSTVQKLKDIKWNDFTVESVLTEDKPRSLAGRTQASLNPIAATSITQVTKNFKFRLLGYKDNVFDPNVDKIYTVTSVTNTSGVTTNTVTPDNGNDLILNSGDTYTFVAYTNGTNTAPNEAITGTNISTGVTMTVSAATGNDFMWFKSAPIQLSGSSSPQNNNYLAVVFKHMFSSITVKLDASYTNGYDIKTIGTGTFYNGTTGTTRLQSMSTATMNFTTGAFTPNGTASNIAQIAQANYTMSNVNAVTGNDIATYTLPLLNMVTTSTARFNLANITIGPQASPAAMDFSGLTIRPGHKYTLSINFKPNATKDETLVVDGIPAVRINGKVWMRHNLGVNTALNADVPSSTIGGNYYNWGHYNVAANQSTAGSVTSSTTTPSGTGWDLTYNNTTNSWNAGTDAVPVRQNTITGSGLVTKGDPCPAGWRVPTRAEWQDLIANTVQSNTGTWNTSSSTTNTNAVAAAKVFRSKRDYNVILTFPTAGYYLPSNGPAYPVVLTRRNHTGYYWTSLHAGSNSGYRVTMTSGDPVIDTGTVSTVIGMNVRCIRNN